jgi:2-oxoglutarate ferredoxin oxidoreductase subunit alpha
MARGQFDYFQATCGGGHGDYRMPVLAPIDVTEAVEHVQLGFHLADKWRTPVLFMGDYLLAHTYQAVEVNRIDYDDPLPAKDWAVDGTRSGTGASGIVTSLGFDKAGRPFIGPEKHWRAMVEKQRRIEAAEARIELAHCDDAEVVVVAFGTLAKFARYVVREMRAEGRKIGFARPITLWPFPSAAIAEVAAGKRMVAVLENNGGQMIDDVRLAVLGAAPVEFIGCISTDDAGFGVGGIYNPDFVRSLIESAWSQQEVPA